MRRFNPDCSDRTIAYAAARAIETNARALKQCSTIDGKWPDDENEAKQEYEDHMLMVREIRARARYL